MATVSIATESAVACSARSGPLQAVMRPAPSRVRVTSAALRGECGTMRARARGEWHSGTRDEYPAAQAAVLIDLSGRPYCLFEGEFASTQIGDYPTQMTAHVFRSLADSMGAAIHVKVEGENDHHKTEACFKAFGRALRDAIRSEGGAIPSTKGLL